jgi:hypothetical protein
MAFMLATHYAKGKCECPNFPWIFLGTFLVTIVLETFKGTPKSVEAKICWLKFVGGILHFELV